MRPFVARFLLALLGGSLTLACSDGTSPSSTPTDAVQPAFRAGGRSGFGFNGSVKGFPTGEVRLTGGGSFDQHGADPHVRRFGGWHRLHPRDRPGPAHGLRAG